MRANNARAQKLRASAVEEVGMERVEEVGIERVEEKEADLPVNHTHGRLNSHVFLTAVGTGVQRLSLITHKHC